MKHEVWFCGNGNPGCCLAGPDGDGASERLCWPKGEVVDWSRGGALLVPIALHPDGALYLQEDGGVVGYYPAREELIRMADGADVFLRRQLDGWCDLNRHAFCADGELGAAWAERLGFSPVDELSDSLERFWYGQNGRVQQITHDGDSVWFPARFDQGFDARETILWAETPAALEAFKERLGIAEGDGRRR